MKRIALIEPSDAERMIGYVVGGISPLGQKKRLPTVIDASVEERDRVLVSAGRRGLSLVLAAADLATALRRFVLSSARKRVWERHEVCYNRKKNMKKFYQILHSASSVGGSRV